LSKKQEALQEFLIETRHVTESQGLQAIEILSEEDVRSVEEASKIELRQALLKLPVYPMLKDVLAREHVPEARTQCETHALVTLGDLDNLAQTPECLIIQLREIFPLGVANRINQEMLASSTFTVKAPALAPDNKKWDDGVVAMEKDLKESGVTGGSRFVTTTDLDIGRKWVQNEEITVMPTTRWEKFRRRDVALMQVLRDSQEIRTRVPDIFQILKDVKDKVAELRHDPDIQYLVQNMDDDELVAIVIYTHDLQDPEGKREGNFYYEENRDLRARGTEARVQALQTWGPHVAPALSGLQKMPDFEGDVFRGFADLDEILRQYQKGRIIQWGAWSSTTVKEEAAKNFAGATGIVLKITVFTGKDIHGLSFFGGEGEILITPNHKFIVQSQPYPQDGFTFIDMIEMREDVTALKA
jgi:hypothetical protein